VVTTGGVVVDLNAMLPPCITMLETRYHKHTRSHMLRALTMFVPFFMLFMYGRCSCMASQH
jgi:hypothetical protein